MALTLLYESWTNLQKLIDSNFVLVLCCLNARLEVSVIVCLRLFWWLSRSILRFLIGFLLGYLLAFLKLDSLGLGNVNERSLHNIGRLLIFCLFWFWCLKWPIEGLGRWTHLSKIIFAGWNFDWPSPIWFALNHRHANSLTVFTRVCLWSRFDWQTCKHLLDFINGILITIDKFTDLPILNLFR